MKTGLNFLQGDRFFLIPEDYPRVASSTYKEMLKIEDPIVIPAYKGKKGHPVLIDSNLADEISNDSSLNSLRDYIEKKDLQAWNL